MAGTAYTPAKANEVGNGGNAETAADSETSESFVDSETELPSDVDESDVGSDACGAAFTEFRTETWPNALETCTACHAKGGFYESGGGRLFILEPQPSATNFFTLAGVAALEANGEPLLLAKARGDSGHGGGVVLSPSSAAYALLANLAAQLREVVPCTQVADEPEPSPGDDEGQPAPGVDEPILVPLPQPMDSGTILLGPAATLRKATIRLAGRVPTVAESAMARSSGLEGVDRVLDDLMTEPAFYQQLKVMFNDLLFTDANLPETRYNLQASFAGGLAFPANTDNTGEYVSRRFSDGTPIIVPSSFDDPQYSSNLYFVSAAPYNQIVIDSVAREPLEMIAHVVRNNRPFTEVLTASYRLVNRPMAHLLGLDAAALGFVGAITDYSEFVEAKVPRSNVEYAGVLTTPSFLFRYMNTNTNRNRARSRFFYKIFLNFDIMKDVPQADLSNVDLGTNPTRNAPECSGCHAIIDPVAGAFQNQTSCDYNGGIARYYEPSARLMCGPTGWYTDMFKPGFGPESRDPSQAQENWFDASVLPFALESLAAQAVKDRAFARSMVDHVLTALTGLGPINAASDPALKASTDVADLARKAAIEELSDLFIDSNFSLKELIKAIVKGPQFRIDNATISQRVELQGLGGSVLSPEVLHSKIISTFGYPWGIPRSLSASSTPKSMGAESAQYFLLSKLSMRIFYGGIDSLDVRQRGRVLGGLGAAVSERMALEMACTYTALDFSVALKATRKLFPFVDATTLPEGNTNEVLANLKYLHERFLGEELPIDDEELRTTYDLLVTLQRQGLAAIKDGTAPIALPVQCQAATNFATGEVITGGITNDPNYVVRAWQGVIAYLLMDYRFLHD